MCEKPFLTVYSHSVFIWIYPENRILKNNAQMAFLPKYLSWIVWENSFSRFSSDFLGEMQIPLRHAQI